MIRGTAAIVVMLALLSSACAPMKPREADPPETSQGETDTPAADPGAETHATAEEAAAEAAAAPDETTSPEPEPAPVDPETPAKPAPEPAPEPEPAARPEPSEAAVSLVGRITLSGGEADVGEAIVYFVPESGAARKASEPASSGPEEIVTRDKTLSPTVLAVSRGSEIRFPNEDPILHNLFSVSAGNNFDVGVYGPSEVPSVTLEQPGVVNIYCNVHHDMHSHVLVVDTPWRTRAGSDGRFRLEGLPTGRGELHVWHRQSEPWSRSLELPSTVPLDVNLNITKPSLPQHRDKTGQPYNRRDRDPYR